MEYFKVETVQQASLFGTVPTKKRGTIGAAGVASSESRKLPEFYFNPFVSIFAQQQEEEKHEVGPERKQQFKETRPKKAKEVPVPIEVREKIEEQGGTKIKMVIRKELTKSDLDKQQHRLSMSQKKAGDGFLEKGEKNKMKEGIPVKILEPCGEVSDLKLAIWKLPKNDIYVLKTGWIKVVEREGNTKFGVFVEGNKIRVWSFRVEGQLWFTIEKVEDDGSNGGGLEH